MMEIAPLTFTCVPPKRGTPSWSSADDPRSPTLGTIEQFRWDELWLTCLNCPTASLTPTNNAHRIWFRLWTHLHSRWWEETPNPACFSCQANRIFGISDDSFLKSQNRIRRSKSKRKFYTDRSVLIIFRRPWFRLVNQNETKLLTSIAYLDTFDFPLTFDKSLRTIVLIRSEFLCRSIDS